MDTHTPGNPWSIGQLAVRWNADPRLIQKMLREGRIRGYHVGRDWRVSEECLHAFEAGEQMSA